MKEVEILENLTNKKITLQEIKYPTGYFQTRNTFFLPSTDGSDEVFAHGVYVKFDGNNRQISTYSTNTGLWTNKEVDFKQLYKPEVWRIFSSNVRRLEDTEVRKLFKDLDSPVKQFTTTVNKFDKKASELKLKPTTKLDVTVVESVSSLDSDFEKYKKVLKDKSVEINTPDFEIKYDIIGDSLLFQWINVKTKKYKGIDLFKKVINIAKTSGVDDISALAAQGTTNGIEATGYYVMMKWGILPNNGIDFINKTLGTQYTSFEDLVNDSQFLPNWKQNGVEYWGTFDLNPDSVSWQMLNKA